MLKSLLIFKRIIQILKIFSWVTLRLSCAICNKWGHHLEETVEENGEEKKVPKRARGFLWGD